MVTAATPVWADEKPAIAIKPDALKWVDVPLYKGMQIAAIFCDQTQAGLFITPSRYSKDLKIPAHIHPD